MSRAHTTTVLGSRTIEPARRAQSSVRQRNRSGANMKVKRRDFLTASSTFVAGLAAAPIAAQEGEGSKTPPVPARQAKGERLFKAPAPHPNALETGADGLWIGDQVSEKVFRVDWQTGKVLHEVQTESHNTSGLAVGGGYLWLNANGGVSGRRPARPADKPFGEIVPGGGGTGQKGHTFPPPRRRGGAGLPI